jgi:hypothetical protein
VVIAIVLRRSITPYERSERWSGLGAHGRQELDAEALVHAGALLMAVGRPRALDAAPAQQPERREAVERRDDLPVPSLELRG